MLAGEVDAAHMSSFGDVLIGDYFNVRVGGVLGGKLNKFVFLAVFLLLGGCLSLTYQAVGDGVPSASVRFAKGYQVGLGDGAVDNYAISNTGECEDIGLAAVFMSTTGKSSLVNVPSGNEVRIIAHTEYYISEGTSYAHGGFALHGRNAFCTNSASFSPVSGGSYSVSHKSNKYLQCELIVVDDMTGFPPIDLKIYNGSGCPKFYTRKYGAIMFAD